MNIGYWLEAYSLLNNDDNHQKNHAESSNVQIGLAIPEITTETTNRYEEEENLTRVRKKSILFQILNNYFKTKSIDQKTIDKNHWWFI